MKYRKCTYAVIFFTIFFLTSGLSLADDADEGGYKYKRKYKVTITNITRGQIFSPPIVISHDKSYQLFRLGKMASKGLALLAEEGNPEDLISELNPDKSDYAVAGDFIMPGDSGSVILETSKYGRSRLITVACMLVTTNDAFLAARNIWFLGKRKETVDAQAYDAGSEGNSEECKDIPGPPCNETIPPNEHAPDAEGYVHVHAGIHGTDLEGQISSLIPAMHDWNNPVAKITIRRIYH